MNNGAQCPGSGLRVDALHPRYVEASVFPNTLLQQQPSVRGIVQYADGTDIFRQILLLIRGVDKGEAQIPLLGLEIFHNGMVQYQLRLVNEKQIIGGEQRFLLFLLELLPALL